MSFSAFKLFKNEGMETGELLEEWLKIEDFSNINVNYTPLQFIIVVKRLEFKCCQT